MRGQGNPWKWIVGGLVVVIVVSTVVLLGTVAPHLSAGLAGDGGGTQADAADHRATATPTPVLAPSTPTPLPNAYAAPTPASNDTPTATVPPTEVGASERIDATFDDREALDDWTVTANGTGDGEAAVREGRLRLRVYRCHQVVVARELGRVDGRLRVSFDWATAAEEWWEKPTWELVAANGTTLTYTVVAGRDVSSPGKGGEKYGRVVAETAADTAVTLRYRVHPSQYCGRANHANTYLWVDNVTVTERSES